MKYLSVVDTDTPQKADVIFLSGGSYPKMPEYAAELFHVVYVINVTYVINLLKKFCLHAKF